MLQALPPPAAPLLPAAGAGAARGAGESSQVTRPRALDSSRAGNTLLPPSYSFLFLAVLSSFLSFLLKLPTCNLLNPNSSRVIGSLVLCGIFLVSNYQVSFLVLFVSRPTPVTPQSPNNSPAGGGIW